MSKRMTPITPDAIRAARTRLGLTQAQLADRLNVPSNTVARWEQGNRTPTGLYAQALRQLIEETLR